MFSLATFSLTSGAFTHYHHSEDCRKVLIWLFYVVSGDTFPSSIYRIKSYDQNKFISDIMAISFVFWPDISECLVDP